MTVQDPEPEHHSKEEQALVPDIAWTRVQLSRHEKRPYASDYIQRMLSSFHELHGDRKFADDPSVIGGFGMFDGMPVMVIGQQKGRSTRERLFRNYGMPKPEGYRKALRLMLLAEKFRRPVLTLIDTPGAYPGIGAEERGQAEAIAANLRAMGRLRVPIIASVLGEGGSGGALAIGMGDRVLMMENAIYSVISPESCSAILWKDQEHAKDAAAMLQLTAPDLLRFRVIDTIVPEPPGGAHLDWDQAAANLKKAIRASLDAVCSLDEEERCRLRFAKFRQMGEFIDS